MENKYRPRHSPCSPYNDSRGRRRDSEYDRRGSSGAPQYRRDYPERDTTMRSRSSGRPYGNGSERYLNGESSPAPVDTIQSPLRPGEGNAKRPSVQTDFTKHDSPGHVAPAMPKPPDPSTASADNTRDPRLQARASSNSMKSPDEFKKPEINKPGSRTTKSPMSGSRTSTLNPSATQSSSSVSPSDGPASIPTTLRDLIQASIKVAQVEKRKKDTDSYLTKTEKKLETLLPFPALYDQEKKSLKEASAESSRLSQQMRRNQSNVGFLEERLLQSLSHNQKPPPEPTDSALIARMEAMESQFSAFKESASKNEKEQRNQIEKQESEILSLKSELRGFRENHSDFRHRQDSVLGGLRTDLSYIQKANAESEARNKLTKDIVERLSTDAATKQSLDQVSKKLADFDNTNKILQQDVQKSQAFQQSLRTDCDNLQEKLDQVRPIEGVKRELLGQIENHATELQTLKSDISSMSETTNGRHEELVGRIEQLSGSVQLLKERPDPTRDDSEQDIEQNRKDIARIDQSVKSIREENDIRDKIIADHVGEEVKIVAQKSDGVQERLTKVEENTAKDIQNAINQIQALSRKLESLARTRVASPNTPQSIAPQNNAQQIAPTQLHRPASTGTSTQPYPPQTLAPTPPQQHISPHPRAPNSISVAPSPHNDPMAAQFMVVDNQFRALHHAMKDMNLRLTNYTSQQVFNAILNAVLSRTKIKDLELIPTLDIRIEDLVKKAQAIEARQNDLQGNNTALSSTVHDITQKLSTYAEATQPRLERIEHTLAMLPSSIASGEKVDSLAAQTQEVISSVTTWKDGTLAGINSWKDEINTNTSAWKDRVDKDVREMLHNFEDNCSEMIHGKTKDLFTRTEDLEKQMKKIEKRQEPSFRPLSNSQQSTNTSPVPPVIPSHPSRSETPRTVTSIATSDNEANELLNIFQGRPLKPPTSTPREASSKTNGHTPVLSSRTNGSTTSSIKSRNGPMSEIEDSEGDNDDDDDDQVLPGPRRYIKFNSRRTNSNGSVAVKSESGPRTGPFDPGPELRRAKLQKRKKESAIDLVDNDHPDDRDWTPGAASSTTSPAKKENHTPKKRKTGI